MAVLSSTTSTCSPALARRIARVSASGLLRTRRLLTMVAPSATATQLAEVTPRSMPIVRFSEGDGHEGAEHQVGLVVASEHLAEAFDASEPPWGGRRHASTGARWT